MECKEGEEIPFYCGHVKFHYVPHIFRLCEVLYRMLTASARDVSSV